ncbi:NADH dehydrogenase 1 beta subcomplex subunit 3 [Naematelia encephala]|uniref:NADH dehydrogenase 1 beta subcomplex subunit 3 n=1 Tax=Naematelia encephala TaxID=71784 RepID=A0A1Y2BF09_9TREE|nr:NADH dehydrogenase 1 beta subcomplex subunit 3 [Naematelia encephala]
MPGPLYRDPWAKREAWRSHYIFSSRNYLRHGLPGFGIASVAFAAYVIYDDFFASKPTHSAGHGEHH